MKYFIIKYKKILLIFIYILSFYSLDRVLNYYFSLKENNLSFCYDDLTLYGYCENSKHFRVLSKKDTNNNKKIITLINNQKLSYDNENNINPNEAKLIIIGDSFVQADEIIKNKRIGSYLNKHTPTLEIGYASWNSYQYNNILEKYKFREDAKFIIFLTSNDFIGENSYLNTIKKKNYFLKLSKKKNNLFEKFLKIYVFENSYIYKSLRKIKNNFNQNIYKNQNLENKYFLSNKFTSKYIDNCKDIIEIKNNVSEILFDYLVFSKNYKCWPKKYKHSVDKSIGSIKKLKKNLTNGQSVHLVFINPGWSFYNENLYGKSLTPYKIHKNTIISQKGIYNYLRNNLENIDDTYEVLIKSKKDKENKFYFNQDGHWNENAHKMIYNWILSKNMID